MKKLLLGACLFAMAGLFLTSCDGVTNQPDKGDYTSAKLVGYCPKNVSTSALTFNGAGSVGAAVKLSAKKLAENGTDIKAIRVDIADNVANCKAFIKESIDGENLVEVAFERCEYGWSYVKLPELFKLEEGKDYFVGYTCDIQNAQGGSPFGFQSGSSTNPNDYLYSNNKWTTMIEAGGGQIKGFMSIQAVLTGGQYEDEDQYDVLISQIAHPNYLNGGEATPITFAVTNVGVRSINGVSVDYTFNGSSAKKDFTKSLETGETAEFVIDGLVAPNEDTYMKNSLTANVPGQTDANPKDNKYDFAQYVVTGNTQRNKLYIEQFTGTWCGWCPVGALAIKESIAGMAEPTKVVWAAHHSGDAMELKPESGALINSLKVQGFPACNLNRMPMPFGGVVFTPHAYISTELLEEAAKVPAKSTLKLERTYNAETKELKVTVSGNAEVEKAKLTVFLVQNGIVANQTNGGSDYVHNGVPRKFFTDALGEEVGTGEFSKEYTYTIESEISGITTKPEDMEVIAIVTQASGKTTFLNNTVLNADIISVTEASAKAPAFYMMNNAMNNEENAFALYLPEEMVCYEYGK